MKQFNTTGVCLPEWHYMVDVTERVNVIRKMIENGDYFCVNRGRQYGKTTMLHAIKRMLEPEYVVLSISFEGLGQSNMATDDAVARTFMKILDFQTRYIPVEPALKNVIHKAIARPEFSLMDLSLTISDICYAVGKSVVLLIDEVDNASNYESFLHFLGMLRNKYLDRGLYPTFKSVILAGVYDIKNLKLKIRNEQQHQYNSPWNIAVPYDEDMSLHAPGIAGMLNDYAADHDLHFDADAVARMIYDYTSGYPFLVSRICQIIDKQQYTWDKQGVIDAVHDILMERNTLFDDVVKKLDEYPELRQLMKSILFSGERRAYSPDEKYMQLGLQFMFIRNTNGYMTIANRILETRLYNLFAAEQQSAEIYTCGSMDKSRFVQDGYLDVRGILERFVLHFNDIYGSEPDAFLEKEGRRLFLLYLRPIINGVGNYYVEAETRDETRTDIVIDYRGHQYVIELKIWRGDTYNERGEKQLSEYLDYYHLTTGYLVSFCFNKTKQPGVKEVMVGEKKIVEAMV